MLGHMVPGADTTRYAWMDSLRGCAILLVVYSHSVAQVHSNTGGSLEVLTTISQAFGPFRMPLLMLLSGMLLAKSLSKPRGVYIRGKLGKVGWPYLLWSAIILGLLAATSSLTGNTDVSPMTFVRILFDPPTYLWYLAYLLLFYLLALLMNAQVRTALIPIALVVSAFLPYEWKRLLFLMAFFFIGDLISRHRDQWVARTNDRRLIAVSAVVAVGASVLTVFDIPVRYEALSAPAVLCGLIAVTPLLQRTIGTRFGRFTSSIGRDSIVFYASHWVMMLVAFHILIRVGLTIPWAVFIATFAISIAGCFALSWLRHRSWLVAALYEWPRLQSRSRASAARVPLG